VQRRPQHNSKCRLFDEKEVYAKKNQFRKMNSIPIQAKFLLEMKYLVDCKLPCCSLIIVAATAFLIPPVSRLVTF